MIVATTLTASNADIIGDALASVVAQVDRCLVIDTGARDATLEVARQVAGDKLLVRDFPWNNDLLQHAISRSWPHRPRARTGPSRSTRTEIPYFLERRKSAGMILLPVLIRPCAWKAIDWLKAIQLLPRDGRSVAVDFKDAGDPPFTLVAESILAVLDKKTKREAIAPPPPPPPLWSPPEKVDIDRLPITGAELIGRQNELKLLDEAWEKGELNVISFVAWGGVGKTTLINKWREQMAAENYRGAKRVFAWSFHSQGTGDRVTSADIFIG